MGRFETTRLRDYVQLLINHTVKKVNKQKNRTNLQEIEGITNAQVT